MTDALQIPTELLPADGRFGCGPAKIRPEAVEALASCGRSLLGTSHRQSPVRSLVQRVREGLLTLYGVPEDFVVVLGNGGSTAFWDIAVSSLITHRSAHGTFGEFSGKFAKAAARAPHLAEPLITAAEPGQIAVPTATDEVDTYAWAHNETSTGAIAPVRRPAGSDNALVLVDGTSAAGTVPVDFDQVDAYYFAPQKGFASDGGLWFAVLSPAAVTRMEQIAATDRWIPEILSLKLAHDNSVKQQTLNTPSIATLVLMAEQLDWMLGHGGLDFCAARSAESSRHLYDWAEQHPSASPFVGRTDWRSPVVGTIDFDDSVDAAALAASLRSNGIVDVEPYRKLNRNQIRVGMFPAIEPDDVRALTACIDWVLPRL